MDLVKNVGMMEHLMKVVSKKDRNTVMVLSNGRMGAIIVALG